MTSDTAVQPRSFVGRLQLPPIRAFLARFSISQRRFLIAILVASDVFSVALALSAAWYLRIGSGVFPYSYDAELATYARAILLAVPIFLAIFAINRLYDVRNLLAGTREYSAVLASCTYGLVALLVVSFMEHDQELSRGWLLLSWLLAISLVGGARFAWRRIFQWLRRSRGWLIERALIVGASEHGLAVARQLAESNSGLEVAGFLDDFLPVGTHVLGDLGILGTPTQLHEQARAYGATQVILMPNAVAWESFEDIVKEASRPNGFELTLSPGFYDIMAADVQVTHQAFVPLLRVQHARVTGVDLLLKVGLDVLGSVLLIILTGPLMLLIALAILLTAGRPVFESHEALGLGGKPIRTVRFRTGLWGRTNRRLGRLLPREIVENPELTFRVGRFLYRTGLDKLPQLFDVLRGHISLVGPRLLAPGRGEVAVQRYLPNLLTTKPGWIGPWAVSGAKSVEEEVLFDVYYIRNWTIWLDLQVLFQAARRVLAASSRKGDA